jgi:hypothetical protein
MEDSELGLKGTKERTEQEDEAGISESEDSNASLLGNEGSSRNNSRKYTQSIPSLRAHLWITAANVILFMTSIAFMFITLSSDKVATLQDHWRATSFYCMQQFIFLLYF